MRIPNVRKSVAVSALGVSLAGAIAFNVTNGAERQSSTELCHWKGASYSLGAIIDGATPEGATVPTRYRCSAAFDGDLNPVGRAWVKVRYRAEEAREAPLYFDDYK
jgi:hypothetical protein